jgi:hypothetical protein
MSNNDALREIVLRSGLAPAVALTVFNRGLGPYELTESAWRAVLSEPDATNFAPLADELLAHAQQQFDSAGFLVRPQG